MNFLIVSGVCHKKNNNQIYGYAPYVREMNIWFKYVDKVTVVAPISTEFITEIDAAYKHNKIDFIQTSQFSLLGFSEILKTIIQLPKIILQLFQAMKVADHIHLRCPGNMGLLGSIIQILFPSKPKTAKYAGNWDLNAPKPWSYKLQQYILNNTFLTKNMQVLVYGEWQGSSKNIKPFFTATYRQNEIVAVAPKSDNLSWKFIFVGTLVSGKKPIYAIKVVEELHKIGHSVSLDFYGDGILKNEIAAYIKTNNLETIINLKGNQNKETLKNAYQSSDFMILPSASEGWPKAVAEAMFWGCIPVATSVSCVPNMVDYGNRGLLLSLDLLQDAKALESLMMDKNKYANMSEKAKMWSQEYTLEKFEQEIKKLLLCV